MIVPGANVLGGLAGSGNVGFSAADRPVALADVLTIRRVVCSGAMRRAGR